MKRNDTLIRRKFNSYLIPSVLMIIAMQLGNIVDSIFVAGFIDTDSMTAISLSLPVLYTTQIPGFAIGIGAAVVISVLLGKRQFKEASGVFSVSAAAVLLISLLISATAPFLSSPLAHLLASTDKLAGLLESYLFYFIAFVPLLNFCILISNVITIDNCPKLGASAFILANIINLTLDYLFLRFFHMGMTGAALSTIIGYGMGNLVIIPYILSKKRMLTFHIKQAFVCIRKLGQVIKAGAAQSSFFIMLILQYFILNSFIQSSLGADNMAIYAVCLNSVNIVKLFVEGVIGVIQTIAGVLYGEKDYFGIRRLVRRTVIIVCFTVAFLMAVFIIFPDVILRLFSFDKTEIYDTARLCVRLFSLSFIFFAANRVVQVYYQTILKTSLATIDTILQGFFFLIPISILFITTNGIVGVTIAAAVTEASSFAAVWIVRMIGQRIGKLPQKGFLMLPDKDSSVLCDISIQSTEEDASEMAHEIVACCRKNNIPSASTQMIALAAEELAVNISRWGCRRTKPTSIDICLSRLDDKLILRVRDDGVPFDPTAYRSEEKDEFSFSGIETIKKVTSSMTYSRVLNLNNTVIEAAIPQTDQKGVN